MVLSKSLGKKTDNHTFIIKRRALVVGGGGVWVGEVDRKEAS